jgi:glyoxylase-like metal-dependent hydrolase (beta-lactamase superfamily II)
VGWSVSPDRAPRFPRARYVVQHDEITALEQAGSPLLSSVIAPLRAADQLHEIDGEVTLTRGPARIVAVPTPGHTPGHQSVLVEAGDRQVIVTGDVLVHAVQLADPDLPYAYEADPALARETRRALLAGGRDAGAVLATAHLTRPFTPIPDPMTD